VVGSSHGGAPFLMLESRISDLLPILGGKTMRKVVFLALAAALLLPAANTFADSAANEAFARQIGQTLKESGELQNYRIGVQYQDGVAKLTGTVTSIEQRDAAVRLAREIAGVEHVVCKLTYPDPHLVDSGSSSDQSFDASQDASLASAESDALNVTHAFGNDSSFGAMPSRRSPMALPPVNHLAQRTAKPRGNMPLPSGIARGAHNPNQVRQASAQMYGPEGCPPDGMAGAMGGGPAPVGFVPHGHGRGPSYENAQMPGYAWPSYAAYPNYAALTYPKQYSPTAWPYIGPFYPYPQVPLAWRKVALEWDDGWWFLDFSAHNSSH
jgi:hypothetical protein